MKVALLGRTRMLYDTIDELVKRGHQITLMGTCKAAPEYDVNEFDFERRASELGIPFFNDVRINSTDIVDTLRKSDSDIAVSVNWITIVKKDAIDSFKHGILNAHCGDLPRYRGNACPNWAILQGEDHYGISIHYMEEGRLDSGNIILKKLFPIDNTTNISEIYRNMEQEIPIMFGESIDMIERGCEAQKQSADPLDALRCYPRIPSDSIIDWNMPRCDIIRIINASCSPFQGAYTFHGSKKIHILNASDKPFDCPSLVIPGQVVSINKTNGKVDIATSDGVVELSEVYVDGKSMRASDVLPSTHIRLNYNIYEEIYQMRCRIDELERNAKTDD